MLNLFNSGALSIPEYDMADIKLVYLRRNMDKMKPTILECDYDVEDNPPYLVVKWFKVTKLYSNGSKDIIHLPT